MKKIMDFFIENWDKVGMILVGLIALVVYSLQKRDTKRNAASLIVCQIQSLKEKLENIVEITSNNQLNETSIYEILDILEDNQWNKYKHLFVGDIDQNSFRIIDKFYEDIGIIREQLILAKKLQQQFFFNNQQLIANDCNYYLMETLEPTSTNDRKLDKIQSKIFDNNTDFQLLESYFSKTNRLKQLFGNQLIIQYIPEQIRITIEKQLNKIGQIEVIGCSGYKKLERISEKIISIKIFNFFK